MSTQLETLFEQMIPALEAEMRAVLGFDGTAPGPFRGMIHYHMGWVDADLRPVSSNSGKRIRPMVCLLSCAAAGGDWQAALPAAAAIEILHNFSLVHDDIEDASPTRRGRATVWQLWGEAQAINAGDAMFAMSHLALTRLVERGVPPATAVTALRRFDQTCVALTEGQYHDMRFEQCETVTVDEYIAMITGKTAVLLSLSAELGALVAGAAPQTVADYAGFGRDLGLAFQVQDDILGIWGDETLTGKSAATDIATRKKTLPVLHGLAQSPALVALYAQADAPADFVPAVIDLLDAAGARAYATAVATAYSESALQHLSAADPQGDAGRGLHQLAALLLQRNY